VGYKTNYYPPQPLSESIKPKDKVIAVRQDIPFNPKDDTTYRPDIGDKSCYRIYTVQQVYDTWIKLYQVDVNFSRSTGEPLLQDTSFVSLDYRFWDNYTIKSLC
jgi:hypothetical protein